MSTKFSSRFNANYNRQKRLESSAYNIFANARRFYWLSSFINTAVNTLRQSDDYKRLPQRDQSFIDGSIAAYRKMLNTETVHGYLCNDGKFRIDATGCEKYKYPSDKSPKTLIDGTGVLVWKNKPEMVYFMGEDTEKVLQACKVKYVCYTESNRELPTIPRIK